MPTKILTGPLWWSLIRVILATGPLLSSQVPSLYLLLLFSFSLPPIARRDDTLLAGDKGSRARGRAKLEMLIPGMVAKEARDGKGEAGVNYETVLILSFIPTRISGPGEEVSRARRRLHWWETPLLLLLQLVVCVCTGRVWYILVVSLEKSSIILGRADGETPVDKICHRHNIMAKCY